MPVSVDEEDQVLSLLGQRLGEHGVRHRLALELALALVLGRDGGLALVRHAHEEHRLLAVRRLLALGIKLVRALVHAGRVGFQPVFGHLVFRRDGCH